MGRMGRDELKSWDSPWRRRFGAQGNKVAESEDPRLTLFTCGIVPICPGNVSG